MSVPLIVWSIVAGMFALALLFRLGRACVCHLRGKHPLVELGHEQDEFFIPGDRPASDDEDYDDDSCDTP